MWLERYGHIKLKDIAAS
ncbi:hypothetical protein MJ749_06090 [Paenibacillus polymyxa]|nr:hypothetical protein [Paenibacillus polymyxa]UMR38179.1 hypothetical protein MJ749_06090 [Paenibacillus polymyxa]